MTADAFNNLSDAGSSLVTLIGFRLAGQKPDHEHPFGHGRFEYIPVEDMEQCVKMLIQILTQAE